MALCFIVPPKVTVSFLPLNLDASNSIRQTHIMANEVLETNIAAVDRAAEEVKRRLIAEIREAPRQKLYGEVGFAVTIHDGLPKETEIKINVKSRA